MFLSFTFQLSKDFIGQLNILTIWKFVSRYREFDVDIAVTLVPSSQILIEDLTNITPLTAGVAYIQVFIFY